MKNCFSSLLWNIFHRKGGYGVHSPFIYYLITQVLQNKTFNLIFNDIEYQRKILLDRKTIESIITKQEVPPPNVGALLFRLIDKFQCMKMIEIGGSTAIMSLYMVLANKKGICYVLEDRCILTDHVRKFAQKNNIHRLLFLKEYEETIRNLSAIFYLNTTNDLSKQGCIFVNRLSDKINEEAVFPYLQTCMHSQIIWVINNIRKDKKMKRLWLKISEETLVKTVLDLYHLGIIFFDKNLPQKQYKKSFYYGL